MAEESFKENLNWKKITIDAINTIIATAIGIVIGLLVDKVRENINNQENYQKIICATINNLEDYEGQISNHLDWIKYSLDTYDEITEMEDWSDTLATDGMFDVFFKEDFIHKDRWIEENFITNGSFIEDADLRLQIGSVYSFVDICKQKILDINTESEAVYKNYLAFYADNEKTAVKKIVDSKLFLNYILKLTSLKVDLQSYLNSIHEINQTILKNSNANQEDIQKMRESSKKINDILYKNVSNQSEAQ